MEPTPGPLEIVEGKTLAGTNWHIYLAAPDGRKIAALWGSQDEKIANAHLFRAAPDMLAALVNVQKLISEAAMTGFNCNDGDWAERLFFSQQKTHAAIALATGRTER